jgi:hypothetical protein
MNLRSSRGSFPIFSLPWVVLMSLTTAWSSAGLAAQLVPTLKQQHLGVLIKDVQLPQTIRNDLRSGLTSRILVQVVLSQESQSLARRAVEITVKYDLWDEMFSVTMAVDNTAVMSNTYSSLDEIVAMLSSLSIPDLFPVAQLPGSKDLVVVVRLLFNPVEKERMEEIRKWVAENSKPAPTASPNVGGGMPAPAPASDSRTLFNRIFEQYAAGASVAAAFTDSATSNPFKLENLHDEK